ncbi:MAG TPA: carboxypeptidase-like regulatory domain-containing protein [Longimicrobiaceae bacterium]|nr:carboxypeptidase-like regulatory domain-containing protein [Longimicrobiaceae bacterium]
MRSLSIVLLALLSAGSLSAQTVQGRVYDPATGAPVSTAFVILLDDGGNRVAATLTRADGQFVARAPMAGSYRLRVERIGYETMTSPVLRLTDEETLAYPMPVSTKAIDLAGIVVDGEQECRIRPDAGLRTLTLWEEARKALAISAWTEKQGNVPFTAEAYERVRNLVNLSVIEEVSRRTTFGYGQQAFISASAEDLAANGYVRRMANGGFRYFGLDARTLLSDSFLDSHCFHVEAPAEEESGLIGLGFRPQAGNDVPDITGVLWLDKETAELQYLEFAYTEHLFGIPIYEEPFGGRVEFQRLSNGGWIVDSWWIRMPLFTRPVIFETETPMIRGSLRGTPAAANRLRMLSLERGLRILEAGGRVTSVVTPGEPVR